MSNLTGSIEELRELYEASLGAPLPYPMDVFAGEVERLLRELEPSRRLRELFEATLEEARLAKVKLDDITVFRRILVRARVEQRRMIRPILGIREDGKADLGRPDEELAEEWKRHLFAEEGRAEVTITYYLLQLGAFRRFLEPRGVKLRQVERDDVLAYKEASIRAGQRASSVNTKLTAVRSFYRFLVETGEIQKNPLDFIRRLKIDRRRLTVLTIAEIEKLMGAITTDRADGLRNYALIVVFCATGARVSEVTRLKVQDLDFGRGVVIYRNRKNNDDVEIAVTENVQATLRRYLAESRPSYLPKVREAYRDYLFLSRQGSGVSRATAWILVDMYAKRAKIEKHVSPHCLRRSIATALANNGMPAELLKVFLGHRNIDTTLNHYVCYSSESQRRAVEDFHPLALGKLLPPKS